MTYTQAVAAGFLNAIQRRFVERGEHEPPTWTHPAVYRPTSFLVVIKAHQGLLMRLLPTRRDRRLPRGR